MYLTNVAAETEMLRQLDAMHTWSKTTSMF